MSVATLALDGPLRAYLGTVGWREHASQAALRLASDARGDAGYRSSAEQVALLQFIMRLIGASRVVEVGCFTGYGALGMALALPEDGRLVTLDYDDDAPSVGRPFWRMAGVAERIELRLGLAQDGMHALLAEGWAGATDLVYVDADKKSYPTYYELALQLVRVGGVVAFDNVLWHGTVADPTNEAHQTLALRAITRKAHDDPRVDMALAPLGDGLLLLRKR